MSDQYKSMLQELWIGAPKHAKDFVFEHENGRSCLSIVTYSLSWTRDMDMIELILSDANIQQKKDILFEDRGIRECSNLIKNSQWDYLNLFIKYTLCCEEDIAKFKQKLIKVKGREIAKYFLEQKALDKIEYFMQWAFKSKEEVNQFKHSLAYVKCKSTLESIIANNKVDMTELDNHFQWCASDNLEMIHQFKAEIPKLYFTEVVCELIEQNRYELLDQFLNWCFVNNQQQIEQFKSGIYKDDDILCFVKGQLVNIIEKEDSFKLLDKFIDWCFDNKQEVKEFKLWLLHPQEELCSVCTNLLCNDKFELADKFIKWCFSSVEEISNFKQILMLSSDVEYIIDPARSDPQERMLLIIKWFNPTKETVEKFKTLFPAEACPDNFYKLLDEFIESNESIVTNSQESVIQEPQISVNNQDYHDNNLQDELTITTVGQEGINHLDCI